MKTQGYRGICKACLASLLSLWGCAIINAQPRYSAVDIGDLGGGYTFAEAVNDHGQAVGYSFLANWTRHGFLYSGGVIHDLGTLGGNSSEAKGINNFGQVVGQSTPANTEWNHAFLYTGGAMFDIGTLGGDYSAAWGVNDSGEVVGHSFTAGNADFPAFFYSGGTMKNLGPFGGVNAVAASINSSGIAVGGSQPWGSYSHAVVYSGGTILDLGTLGGVESAAAAINDSGLVVGSSKPLNASLPHAFSYSGGTMHDLGTLGGSYSMAWGVNNSGQVVGEAAPRPVGQHAFLYSGGIMYDLNDLVTNSIGTSLYVARDINESGQIVAVGDNNHSYLLTPVPKAPTNHAPVAICTNVTVSADSNCLASASINNGSFDADGDAITLTQVPTAPYPIGSNYVCLHVTDSHGASNACCAVVFVVDTTPPIINCPTNIIVTNDPGQCSAVVVFSVQASDCALADITCDNPSGSVFPIGITTVNCNANDAFSNTAACSFTVTVRDNEAPLVACRQAPNPSDKKIPVSGKNASSGQNPDGYYQLLAKDNCDPNPSIYVQDTASSFVAGPFASGDIVKLMQNPGGTPSSDPGTPPIVANIHLNGDAMVYASDASGNLSPNPCLARIPPKPKAD